MKVKYIGFSRSRPSKSGKTRIWDVIARSTAGLRYSLGEIKWAARWRRYAYFPKPGTVYEQDCLLTIADFIEGRTSVHKKLAAKKRALLGYT